MGSSATKAPIPVIYDGDMGGDDMWGIMVALAHPDRFDVKGITSVFGNVDCDHATRNVLSLLSHYGYGSVPVYKGASKPLYGACMFGDGAYGDDGIGGVILAEKESLRARPDATNFIIETVLNSPEPVTIFGTGPSTNIAQALLAAPQITDNIDRIILMGGGLSPGPKPNVSERSGNITIHSEFNFFQDPYAANVIFNNDNVETHVMTMDATQNIHLDPLKKARLQAFNDAAFGDVVVRFLAPAEALDRPKFGVDGPFIHDPNVVTYVLDPALYAGRRAYVSVEEYPQEDVPMQEMRHGKMKAVWDRNANVKVIDRMTDRDGVFNLMESSLRRFAQGRYPH